MKKNYITIIAALLIGFTAKSQQQFVGFEDLTLAADTFWNGSDGSGQFISNSVVFNNDYAGYWKGGFAYSNKTDITTSGYTNSYSCIKGKGAGNSSNYAVFTNLDTTAITLSAGESYDGFWINNSTYAYLSMKNGDSFAKKFGDSTNANGAVDGTNGNDWFKLTIKGENNDSVEFFLADFRGADSTDYILKDWTYVSLAGLDRNSKKITFALSSSDNGSFGMNTPAYFCLDSLSFSRYYAGKEELETINYSVFPNPTTDFLTVLFENKKKGNAQIMDVSGRQLFSTSFNESRIVFDFSQQAKGTYFLLLTMEGEVYSKKIIKH